MERDKYEGNLESSFCSSNRRDDDDRDNDKDANAADDHADDANADAHDHGAADHHDDDGGIVDVRMEYLCHGL